MCIRDRPSGFLSPKKGGITMDHYFTDNRHLAENRKEISFQMCIRDRSEITITCNGDDEDSAIAAIEEVLRAQKIIG